MSAIRPVKVCFLGTPDFAATHLKALLADSRYKVVGVVTQPDRPAGRKLQLTPSAVKNLALENGLPVLTPENLRKMPEAVEEILSWNADVAVVVAFGQILAQSFLDSFKFGAVNVHGSLLPRWRGAAPIQRSLEAGESETGVSLQKMVFKLDAGPVVGERKIILNSEINATELYQRLAVLGCELLINDLLKYVDGQIDPQIQDESNVTFAKKIEKEESVLDWTKSAIELHNKIRAFSMGPGTFTLFNGKRLKIHKTVVESQDSQHPPGTICEASERILKIQTGSGVLSLLELQPESKPKISVVDFLKSSGVKKGDRFGI